MGKARNKAKKDRKKKKKQQQQHKQKQQGSMNVSKASMHEVGFAFYRVQLRERDPDRGFVLQVDDPSLIIDGEEILLNPKDGSPDFTVTTCKNGEIHEIIGSSKRKVSDAFRSSFLKLVAETDPNSTSFFQSDTKYWSLEGRDGGLFFGDQMILSHRDCLKLFSKAARQFTHDYR